MIFEVVSWPSRSRLQEEPRILLRHDEWDDFGRQVTYRAWLVSGGPPVELGSVKILTPTGDPLGGVFASPPPGTVSLGQSRVYYEELASFEEGERVLALLGDVSRKKSLAEDLPPKLLNETLCRFPEARQLYLEGGAEPEPVILDVEIQLDRRPSISDEERFFAGPHRLHIPFGRGFDRLAALVGRNGTGKSRLLSYVAKVCSGREVVPGKSFPFTGGVLAINYGALDPFGLVPRPARSSMEPQAGTAYRYCGLRAPDGFVDVGAALDGAIDLLQEHVDLRDWRRLLRRFGSLADDRQLYALEGDDRSLREAFRAASAGHELIALVLAHLLAYLDEKMLVLIDEPEIHLHPSLLSTFTRIFHELLEEREAFGLVVTHSPVPLQEIPGHMIRVVRLEERVPRIDPYPGPALGEDLADIVVRAFGLEPAYLNFQSLIEKLIAEGRTRELEDLPHGLGIPGQMVLRALEQERDVDA